MQIKILVVDDEESICEILKYNLQLDGYDVDYALSGEEALGMDLSSYNLIILDIMMERLSGYDVAKRLKNNTATENIPIIFCSALNGEDDTVMGLNIGGDDYITKPFVISEVLARVRAVLRRSHVTAQTEMNIRRGIHEPSIVFKNLRIDRNTKTCYRNGEPLPLTRTEFELLLFFLTHRNRIYSRQEIIRNVWPSDVVVTSRTIDTNVTHLRKKIEPYDSYIVTRSGFGYGFNETD